MLRDKLFDIAYFSRWIDFEQKEAIDIRKTSLKDLPKHDGRVLRATSLVTSAVQIAVMRYGRGDAIAEIRDSILQIKELLELKHSILASVQLEEDVRQMYERLDLGRLYESLALLAFMVSLRFSVQDTLRALDLIGHAGEDALLDHIALIFAGDSRPVVAQSKFPKIYGLLVEIIESPADQRASKLKKYVEGWYKRMKPIYWHDSHEGAEGAYFGYWCFEAALVAMLFDIDDSGISAHPHYPADLVRHYRSLS